MGRATGRKHAVATALRSTTLNENIDSSFQGLFGAVRGIGDDSLDAKVPTQAARDRSQRLLADARAGYAGNALAALAAHRGQGDLPLISSLLDATATALCDQHVHEQEETLKDFFVSTVRNGRSDRILQVQLAMVRRPALTPLMLHLWPEGGPDKNVHDRNTEVVTACGLRSGQERVLMDGVSSHFQHADSGAWAGECSDSDYRRCPKCLVYLTEHPQAFPETQGGLADVLPASDLARMLDEQRQTVTEKLRERIAKNTGVLSEEWARKITYTALRRAMLDAAVRYVLADKPKDPRFHKFVDHSIILAGQLERVGYTGRMVDVLSEDEWREALSHRRPPLRRPLSTVQWVSSAGGQTFPKTPRQARNARRKKFGDALWWPYHSRALELDSADDEDYADDE